MANYKSTEVWDDQRSLLTGGTLGEALRCRTLVVLLEWLGLAGPIPFPGEAPADDEKDRT